VAITLIGSLLIDVLGTVF